MPIGHCVVKQGQDTTCMEYNGMEGKKRQGPAHWEVCHFSGGRGLSPTWCDVEKLTQSLLNTCKLWKHDWKPKGNKEQSVGLLAAYTFEHSPNAHSVVCFCVCLHQDCFLEEVGPEPKHSASLRESLLSQAWEAMGRAHGTRPTPALPWGQKYRLGARVRTIGVLHMRSSEEGNVRRTRQQCEHVVWACCWRCRAMRSRPRAGRRPKLEGPEGMVVVIFTSLIDAECFNFAN